MQCTNPIWLDYRKITVPCQKCRGCRIRRSSEWTQRLIHESSTYGHRSCFITLTYSDKFLPFNGTLLKEDLQKFFKRLRQRIKPKKIKYYACGEYGEVKGRCHYHAIILGLSNSDDDDRNNIISSWPYCDWKKILRTPNGQKAIGMVTPDSIRYVADYIHKKYNNKDTKKVFEHYGFKNPEFQVQSLGIGKDYALSQQEEIKKTGKILWRGKEIGIPRYYSKKNRSARRR